MRLTPEKFLNSCSVPSFSVRYLRGALEYQLNVNDITSTKYFVARQDCLQVYPGDPINVLGTVRVRLR